jgi:hypothetical protein
MKRCPKCNRQYDASLNFCTEDGTALTPRYDSEAETLKNTPKQPELSPQDVIMELANYLRSTIRPADQVLIRFDQVAGLTLAQVSEHIDAAAKKANCKIIDKSDTQATVQRSPRVYL